MNELAIKILKKLATPQPYKALFTVIDTFTDKAHKYEEAITNLCVSVFVLVNTLLGLTEAKNEVTV